MSVPGASRPTTFRKREPRASRISVPQVSAASDPDFRVQIRAGEAGRHDSDDRHGAVIEHQIRTQRGGVEAEASLPQRMGDDGDRVSVPLGVFFREEESTRERLPSEDVEIAFRHEFRVQLLRLRTARQRQGRATGSRHRGDGSRALSPIVELGERCAPNRDLSVRQMVAVEEDEFLVFLERQRLQKRRVDHAENRRVAPECERQRCHRDQREARAATKRPERVPEVLSQSTHRHHRPLPGPPASSIFF